MNPYIFIFRFLLVTLVLALSNDSLAQNKRQWATFMGTKALEKGSAVTTDIQGNVYIAGGCEDVLSGVNTAGLAFAGFQNSYGGGNSDGFVVKYDAFGNLLWSTFYGGTDYDFVNGIAVDSQGNVYISGNTNSTNNIANNGYQNSFQNPTSSSTNLNAFVIKFDAMGNRLWGTYYAGPTGIYYTTANDIVCDQLGNVTLYGNVFFNNQYDVFVAKFSTSGSLLFDKVFGGSDSEIAHGIDCDQQGNIVFLGLTFSNDLPVTTNSFQSHPGNLVNNLDFFIVKCNSLGAIDWSTYYGDSLDVFDGAISCDINGNIYVTGWAEVRNLNTYGVNGYQNHSNNSYDAFLTKFSGNGNLIWSTYYGGVPANGTSRGISIDTDMQGNVFMCGTTESMIGIAYNGFQNTLINQPQPFREGLFLVKFDSNGIRLCSTYYEGMYAESCYSLNNSIATDVSGNVYMLGYSDGSNSTNIVSGGFQMSFGGITDALLVKFSSCSNGIDGIKEDISTNYKIILYPNPCNDLSILTFSTNKKEKLTIALFNTLGEQIKIISDEMFSVGEHKLNINIYDIASGIYVVQITNESGKMDYAKMNIIH